MGFDNNNNRNGPNLVPSPQIISDILSFHLREVLLIGNAALKCNESTERDHYSR